MSALRVRALRPFVPSGKDFEESRRLFRELGFEEEWAGDGYAGLRNGDARFILQKFDVRSFAENFMVRLDVADLDAWFAAVAAKGLEAKFPGFRISPPVEQPWGREVTFVDPAGVCWLVGEG